MLKSINIQNYRAFHDFAVNGLGRVNLIAGKNNTGKTALLEAVRVLLGVSTSQNLNDFPTEFRVGVGGADKTQNFWYWLFHNKDVAVPLRLSGGFADGKDLQLSIGLKPNEKPPLRRGERVLQHGNFGNMNCLARTTVPDLEKYQTAVFTIQPTNPVKDAIEFNRVVIKRKKGELVRLLKLIEPSVEALETLQTDNQHSAMPLIYADVGLNEMIPVVHLGQGFSRLLAIFSEILSTDAKVLLIDEIENGIHHSVMQTVWEGLFRAARELDLQVFATTHSWECIVAADNAARKGPAYDLRLIRLDRVNKVLTATTMDEKTLKTAEELDWELR